MSASSAAAPQARRSAPCGLREEAAVGEEALRRRRSACRSGQCVGAKLSKSSSEICASPPISKSRSPVILEAGQRRMLAEDVGGRLEGESVAEAEALGDLADDPPVGLALAGRGRKARWREMRRSELVTVPDFSPQAWAGSSTCAPELTVSFDSTFSETTNSSSLPSASRTRIGVRQRHGRVGAHHPQRLDLAAADGLEHLHRFEALARRHVRRLPEPPHAVDVLRRETPYARQAGWRARRPRVRPSRSAGRSATTAPRPACRCGPSRDGS